MKKIIVQPNTSRSATPLAAADLPMRKDAAYCMRHEHAIRWLGNVVAGSVCCLSILESDACMWVSMSFLPRRDRVGRRKITISLNIGSSAAQHLFIATSAVGQRFGRTEGQNGAVELAD